MHGILRGHIVNVLSSYSDPPVYFLYSGQQSVSLPSYDDIHHFDNLGSALVLVLDGNDNPSDRRGLGDARLVKLNLTREPNIRSFFNFVFATNITNFKLRSLKE